MNLSLLVDMAAAGFADRVLIGGRGAGLTAEQIRRLSIAGAREIRSANADALVYLGVNGPTFPIAMFAAARAGVPLIPLNYRLGAEQLAQLLQNHPNAVGIADPTQIDRLRAPGLPCRTVREWRAAIEAVPVDDEGPAETGAPALLIYTSGTTSTPKGVLISHQNLVSYVVGTVEFAGAGADEASLISVPPYHIAAVANAVTNLYAGRRTVVLPQFTADHWADAVRQEQITHALVVPTMLARVMELADELLEVPSLRSLAYGGAAMPTRVIERALRRWPHVDFVNAYGLTETSSTIAVLGPEDHRAALTSEDPAVRARLASAGRVLPGIELEIRDGDGWPVPPGINGRIWVRGDQVSGRYANAGPAVDDAGFFDTRDRGHLDQGGYLFVGGRADDTIMRGGENIAPAEIEDVLLSLEPVVDAVVVGIPDEVWGERIEAAVVLRGGAEADAERLRAEAQRRLRSSKTPDVIHVWDELPRTETGKLIRRDAVERILNDRVGI